MSRPHHRRRLARPCSSGKVRSRTLAESRARQPANRNITRHYLCPECRGYHWTDAETSGVLEHETHPPRRKDATNV